MEYSNALRSIFDIYFPVINSLIVTLATVLLAWLTSRYVKLTKHMVDAMREIREPSVYVDFELPENMLRFTVGNAGQTPAKNVLFEIIEDINWLQFFKNKRGISSIAIITSGVSYLTPGRTLKFRAGYIEQEGIPKENSVLRMNVMYENETGKKFIKQIAIDMIQYKNVLFESFKDPNIAVAEAIKETERSRDLREHSRSFLKFSPQSKACPMCAEKVPMEAKKCSHCGELLPDTPQQPAADGQASAP